MSTKNKVNPRELGPKHELGGVSTIGKMTSGHKIETVLFNGTVEFVEVERINPRDIDKIFAKKRKEHRRLINTIKQLEELERNDTKLSEEIKNHPPSWAEKILCIITPHEKCDAVLGDFSELYQKHIEKYGVKRARYMYSSQVIRSAGPLLWVAIKRLALVLVGWKLTG
ncbi:hypothetical protein KL86PLE_100275 [uncultured Pleomorphomonas sp.]|uniref:Uncharacterized protein n=1 Tax=uncultured Pleomorphomonas sp. TaxID=442121 RepID=A0A212L236_9HYPH|nr:permease prefix domain 2-containing transporter [uncultured Pleomorphomonas sp.]SCM71588.1 hypothetical protein KL86PLE_100275 [uncultured Pleomorphomonas sp.]